MCFKMSLVPIPIGVQGYKSKDKAAEMQVVFFKIQPNFVKLTGMVLYRHIFSSYMFSRRSVESMVTKRGIMNALCNMNGSILIVY